MGTATSNENEDGREKKKYVFFNSIQLHTLLVNTNTSQSHNYVEWLVGTF